MQPDYQKAETAAQSLLTKYGIQEPIIDIFDIAEREGAGVLFIDMPHDLEDVSGFVDFEDKCIYVNDADAATRQMFTVAHELGHFLLHKGHNVKVLPRFVMVSDKNSMEQEANCFAANILVPTDMLQKTLEKYHLTTSDTAALAILFGVSKEFMKFRLLHHKP